MKSREKELRENPEADMTEEERENHFGKRNFKYTHEVSK